jgi:hypothetical protein
VTATGTIGANAAAGNLRATIGGYPGDPVNFAGVWFAAAPTTSNFALLGTATGDTIVNAAATLDFRVGNTSRFSVNSSTITTFGTIQCLDAASSVYAMRLDTESSSRLFQVESTHATAVTATFKAIVGQSANTIECLTSINTVTFSVGPTGTVTIGSLAGLLKATAGVISAAAAGTDYAGPGAGKHVFELPEGNAAVGTDQSATYGIVPVACTCSKVWVSAKIAPVGAALILDILKSSNNGSSWTSLWATTPANRPTLAAGANNGSTASFDTTSLSAGDWLRIDVAQVGSTVAGSGVVAVLATT